ncbi:hypothetical protein TOPH_05047 [Tolypocladium ophioglossoides CBS 100239]|uniref:Uncharacterized protein n=1 Tax=Tolypocladium ophioglossoides (strain CBS 100239) TaxID=1163406 RepID=A0A0L0N8F1_TOLOC|nr:hypothetical protein TOPH_05047 [Tolypocladium ophioglossoides CBS 100239]
MSVVGVDFGTLKTVVAVARNRGVDVVRTCEPVTPLIRPPVLATRSLNPNLQLTTLLSTDHQ